MAQLDSDYIAKLTLENQHVDLISTYRTTLTAFALRFLPREIYNIFVEAVEASEYDNMKEHNWFRFLLKLDPYFPSPIENQAISMFFMTLDALEVQIEQSSDFEGKIDAKTYNAVVQGARDNVHANLVRVGVIPNHALCDGIGQHTGRMFLQTGVHQEMRRLKLIPQSLANIHAFDPHEAKQITDILGQAPEVADKLEVWLLQNL